MGAPRTGRPQESPVLEEQELHQSSWTERSSQGVGEGSQEGQGYPQALRDTNRAPEPPGEHPHPWLSSLNGCSVCLAGPGSSSEGLGQRLPAEGAAGQERNSHSTGLGAYGAEDMAQVPALPPPPGIGKGWEGLGQRGCSCRRVVPSWADQHPRPESLQDPGD